ncbi:hypothetical protein GSI_03443 [Ganoderma sinense ZZ0214-1]|uniref:Uncharacterized protein n=1 Tax=Ganoderma sinense ZZ0214-1 TaxID=1077348 RepID=A0A2G8SLQ3_9APHY|nr:hypothetical protein GSI_03443 [Ganoderma sinense ZZ0214-1]
MASQSPPTTRNEPLKRKRSKEAMSSTTSVSQPVPEPIANPPVLCPIILPDIRRNPDEPYVDPPSPAATEIVEEPVELMNQDHVIAAKEAGIKVRDFAYQPTPKGRRDIRAPEHWGRPLDRLVIHDRYIRLKASSERFGHGTPGKLLWGLLSTGLVTKEEAEANWRRSVEWKAYNEYVNRPLGPYPVCLPRTFKKPTVAYRKRLLHDAFESDLGSKDVRPEEDIFMPPDEPGMDDGPAHLPEPERALRRLIRAPQSISYRTVYNNPSQPTTLPKPTKAQRAPSQSRAAKTTPSRPATPTPSSSTPAAGHNATVDSVHVDKRRRTSGPPAVPSVGVSGTPPATPPAGSSRAVGHTPSRSTSCSTGADDASRSGTPPAEEPPCHPLGRSLTRTRTLSRIPVQ